MKATLDQGDLDAIRKVVRQEIATALASLGLDVRVRRDAQSACPHCDAPAAVSCEHVKADR